MADKEINLWLRVKDGVTSAIGNIKSSFSKNIDAMKQSALIFAGGFAGLVAGVWKAVEAFKTQERVTDQTNKVLASTAHAAGLTADEIAKMAREFQKTTGVSDEVTQSAQNILLTFTGIKKDIFPDVTKATLDMTAAMNHGVITQENLKQQAIQVGKALNDPIQGMSALRRVGVSFNEQQKEQIKTMQEAGNIAGAQKIMLAELKKEFGGSAENLNTLVGAQRAAQSAMGDMMEVIGEAFMPAFRAIAILIKDVAE
jgi:phage-related minor tail protein